VTVAYIVNTYPRASHSFIRREILALERQGLTVHRIAMRSDRGSLVDPQDFDEDTKTEHVLEGSKMAFLRSALGWLATHPRQSLSALWTALRFGSKGKAGGAGTGGRLRHLAYLLEAAHVARRCTALGATHLHAHFGTNSATVALLAHRLGAAGYSFTVHGPEEFDAPRAFSFPQKMHEARFTVAVSSFGRSQLLRWSAIADWPRIAVVHCGVDTTRFDPPAPMPEGGPHLVAIGRLSEQKGFPLLIETMAMACTRLPDLRLTICGDGDLRGLVDSEIARHGLTDRITITGWISEAGIRAAIAASHALILPSLAEGLPMVVMEAMACGRPIIATAIAGIPELVTPDTGWLVPAGDPAALAEAIQTLADTPRATLMMMGSAARTRVFARHNIDTEAAKLAALFSRYRGA